MCWWLWCLALVLALLQVPGVAVLVKLLALAALVAAAWLGAGWLSGRSPAACRRIGWMAGRGWWFEPLGGCRRYVQRAPTWQALGPWLLLHFRADRRRPGHGGFHVLLDRSRVEPAAFSALQTLLVLNRPDG